MQFAVTRAIQCKVCPCQEEEAYVLTKSLISAPMGNNNSKNSKPQKQNEDNFEDFDSQISKFSRQQSSTGQDSPRLSTKISAKQSAKESPRLSKVSASVKPGACEVSTRGHG